MPPFVRYTLIGGVATAAHYALLLVLVEGHGVAAPLSAGLGAVFGAQVAFVGNRWLTFGAGSARATHPGSAGEAHRTWAGAWWRFQVTAAGAAALSAALVALAPLAGLHYLAAQVLATLLNLVGTYTLNRRWTFAATNTTGL
jgi:putative flippase GtrA